MNTYETYSSRGFYRSADNAMLGGVCAGLADHFGFNLRVTSFLTLIAFCVAFPMAVIVYFAIVFLIPAKSTGRRERVVPRGWRARRAARDRASVQMASYVLNRTEILDQRLARLEKYITSSRYELDEKLRKL